MKTRRLGDHGDDVGLLQRRLIRAGYPVQVTHLYDAATEAAVIALQRNTGLVDDGIAGPKTCAALATGRRDPTHLALADLERAHARSTCRSRAFARSTKSSRAAPGSCPTAGP